MAGTVALAGLVLSLLLLAILRRREAATRRLLARADESIARLREREARFRAIVESEPDCVAIVSLDKRFLEVNPAGLALFEADTPDEVIGRSVWDFIHADDRVAAEHAQVHVAAGGTARLGLRVVGRRGRIRWVEASAVPLRNGEGAITGVLSVVRDVTEPRETHVRLLRTTNLLEAVFRAVPDLFFLVDRAGTILEFRGGALADLHLPPERFLGRKFADVLPEPVAGQLNEAIASVLASGEPVTIEYALETQGGGGRFEARLLPLGTDVVVVARNITDRHRAEEALRTSEEQYRRIVETASEGIWTMDAAGRLTFVNPRMAELLGYAPLELIGRSVFDFVGQHGHELDAGLLDHRRAGLWEQHDVKLHRRDGRPLWAIVSARPIFDAAGALAGVLAMVTDITARKEVEEAYLHTQWLMGTIVENSPDMIFVKDAKDLRFVLFNRAGEDILGYERGELIGKSDYDFFPADEADFFTRKDREVLAGGRILEIPEEPIQTRTKGLRYLRTVKVPILDPSGAPRYLLGMSEDVTERRRMEDHLRQAQKMEAIGTLAGGIAHDFNNILGSILGFGELARMDCAGNPRALENVENVLEAGRRAKDLVEQLMAFSRQCEPDLQPLDPGAAVASALKLVRAALPASISIETNLATPLPAILADPTQLHQLVMNLATNGAQAMAESGGVLVVALDQATVDGGSGAAGVDPAPGEYARLTVRDTGVGMDPTTLERMFEPFFTTKKPGHGTGLGLSVVHGIVKSHGGTIRARSQPGRGTTIEVYLPAHGGAVQIPALDEGVLPRGRGEHILFVDDEAPLVGAGRGLLERFGYRVTATTDPLEAVTVFRDRPDSFDLVITDLTMPALSGADLAQQLLRIRPDIPILLTTGFGGRLSTDAARSIGVQGLLAKPTTARVLAWTVHRTLGRAA